VKAEGVAQRRTEPSKGGEGAEAGLDLLIDREMLDSAGDEIDSRAGNLNVSPFDMMIYHRNIEEAFGGMVEIDSDDANCKHEGVGGRRDAELSFRGIEDEGGGGGPANVGHVDGLEGSVHEEDHEDSDHHQGTGAS
jgi:hypothetical protein